MRTVVGRALFGLLLLSGCSGESSETVASLGAPLTDPARVLGFEASADWSTQQGALSLTSVHSQGASAIALGAVASGIDVANTFAGQIEDPPKNDYSAESVEGVIAKAKQGIEDLKEAIEKAEQKIVDAMTNSSGTVASYTEDFVAPRPTLAEQGTKDPDVGGPDND